MASYEKQQLRTSTFTGTGGSYTVPPEVLVCMECGAMVWPTRISLHDTWHNAVSKATKAARDLTYGDYYPQRRRPKYSGAPGIQP